MDSRDNKTGVTAIIQARMTSSRLPGKVMKEVLNRPLIGYLIERLRCCRRVDDLILATTINPADDPLVRLARELDVTIFRGSENDVLERFYRAARMFDVRHIMRITADCPLLDPHLLDELIAYYFTESFDYVSNCIPPTLPDGLDAEVFTFESLQSAHRNATRASDREHVTPYIRTHGERFKTGTWSYDENLSHLRWTVDTPEDYELVRRIIEHVYPVNKHFGIKDILTLLNERPDLIRINAHRKRNEGYLISLRKDQEYSQNAVPNASHEMSRGYNEGGL